MKTTVITELVQFKVLETTTNEQIETSVKNLNEFQKKLNGFIGAEFVKDLKENFWCIIFHYENFEKVQIIGEKLRNNRVFPDFKSLIKPESLNISFYYQLKKWE